MAEEQAAAQAGAKGLGFLTRKVGPLPIGVWILIFGAMYLYMAKRSKGSAQTDPAGNTGTIDPATGYVYGSAQDAQALQRSSDSGGGGTSGAGTSGSTTAGQYPDDASWGRAAVNYLVGLGVDPTSANEAIQQYLSSQPLTPQQQGDVNLAIQGIGAPPQLPGPTGTPPPPVTTPPSGTVYASNPPTGLTVSSRTGNTVTLKWNSVTNATGYQVKYGTDTGASAGSVNVGASVTTATVGGLSAGTLYHFQVQATPAKQGDPFASITATTDKSGSGSGPVTTAKVATRNSNLGNTLGSTEFTTWSALFRWAYHGYDSGQINRYAYLLAQANHKDSASSSPKGMHNIVLPQTLA